jgi:hypothetical protein
MTQDDMEMRTIEHDRSDTRSSSASDEREESFEDWSRPGNPPKKRVLR